MVERPWTAEEYRKRADELRRRVAVMSDVDTRVMFTQMATKYGAIAASIEAEECKGPPG